MNRLKGHLPENLWIGVVFWILFVTGIGLIMWWKGPVTPDLSGEGLRNELARLKSGGLLTRDVFYEYVKIR